MTKAERLEKQKARFKELIGFEQGLWDEGYENIIGVDEVGRGPLAGPVVTAAVVLPKEFDLLGVDDSKKVTEKRRKELYPKIMEQAVSYAFGMADYDRIDEINILNATKEAMTSAVSQVMEDLKSKGIATGNDLLLVDAVEIKGLEIEQKDLIKGDATSMSIAAASILAKVKRDTMMEEFDQVYPGYDFAKNKGYGTKNHYKGLEEQGPCPIHRISFLGSFFEKQNKKMDK